MERTPVSSSNLAAAGHDPVANMLEVEFKNGAVWQYQGVTADTYDAMIKAPSAGSFFTREIKGKYPEEKITG